MKACETLQASLRLTVFTLLAFVSAQPMTAQVNTSYKVLELKRLSAKNPGPSTKSEELSIDSDGPTVENIRFARKINSSGQAVGRSSFTTGSNSRAVLWTGSEEQGLGMLPGGDYSGAFGINDSGQVVGTANTPNTVRAFLWTATGRMRELSTLPRDNGSEAFDINSSGYVVGTSSGANGIRAVLWKPDGTITSLSMLPGETYSRAFAINDSGQMVGTSSSALGNRAVLWTPDGVIRDLGTLPGDSSSEALSINNSGSVVGYSRGPSGTRAFLWTTSAGMQSLGTLPGGDYSQAFAINNLGQVVGTSSSSQGIRGFVWSPSGGMVDLNGLIPASLGLVLSEALCINDLGLIGALSGGANHAHTEGADQDQEHIYRAYILTP